MTSALDITRSVNPPRAAFLDYPLGHTAGPPGEPDVQRAILLEALGAFTELTEPGSVKMLPFAWPAGEGWKDGAESSEDKRLLRSDAPQYQTDEDRLRAESRQGDRN